MAPDAKLRHNLLIVALLLVAFALRVAYINQVPAGLSHDEAYNGIKAIDVLNGERRIFFEINKGIEPLIIYLEALAFYLFGVGPVPLRLVNIFCGMLTVALVYPFAARLFNRRVALLAVAGVAISFWAVFVSRLTLRAVLLPPLLLLTLYLFWRGLKPGRANLAFFALSGLAAGVTMYTYLSSRFVPFIVLAIFGDRLLRRQIGRTHWLGLALHFFILAALFAPLGNYFIDHADSFTRRADQVTNIPQLREGNVTPILRSTLRTLGMFTFRGDTTGRYNLDGRPVFDWLNGALFYAGVGIALWRLRRPSMAAPSVLLLGAAFFMLLPDFITDDSPHFLRTIGAMPIIYIFWALGVNTIIRQIGRWPANRAASAVASRVLGLTPHASLLFLLLTLTTLHTGYDYFGRWANSPNARYIYGTDIAEIAGYISRNASRELTVISAEYYRDLDPFRFKLHFKGHPPFVLWFDGRQSLAVPPPESNLSPRYIFPASAPPADAWLEVLQPQPGESGREYTLYRLPQGAPLARLEQSMQPVGVTVNNDLQVRGYKILGRVVNGGKFMVLIGWQALRTLPPGTDYTFLVQMRDNQGHLWLQVDGNGYRPADWQPGVRGLQLLTFRLPGDLPPRTYHLSLQVVDRHRRQALPTANGKTEIPLATVVAGLDDVPHAIELERLPNPIKLDAARQKGIPELALRGYELARRTVQPGDDLLVTMHWQVLSPPQQNYRLQFYLVDRQSRVVHRWPPLEPVGGEWPTIRWPANYWVQDKANLPVSADVPHGTFNLQLRWVKESGPNLPVDKKTGDHNFGPVHVKTGR